MNIDIVVVSFFSVVVAIGIGAAMIIRFSNSIVDQESKITGIWTNESDTLRILIYSMESRYQAEVVWTRNIEVNLLGSDVIRNLNLKYFGSGEGTYIDPFTKRQFTLKLKIRNAGCLHFHLVEKIGKGLRRVEAWRLVQ